MGVRRSWAWRGGLACLVAMGLAACASGGEADGPPADTGAGGEADDGGAEPGEGGSRADADGSHDGGANDAHDAHDAHDANDGGASDASDGGKPADASGDAKGDGCAGDACAGPTGDSVYVAPGGDDNDPGTKDAPVRSIFVGIARAQQCQGTPCAVKIAEGTYADALTLASGVDLYGGYAPDFASRDPAAHPTVITSAEERTVVADALYAATRIDGVTIEGATLGGFAGKSSYAVWVHGLTAPLTIANATIIGGAGEPGLDGERGKPTSCNAAGGAGGTGYDCGASQGTRGSADGDPANGGLGGKGGGSNCPQACPLLNHDGVTDGADGAPGGDGAPGVAGAAPADAHGVFNGAYWLGPAGKAGERGTHGTGGGGGGSGGSKHFAACIGCKSILLGGSGANGAPGGCAGGGGTAGGAGGGGFALVVQGAAVTLKDVTVTGGVGGNGGVGGDGADGAPGGTSTGTGRGTGEYQHCSGIFDYNAANGGNGGVGGAGGPGGGGAGGAGGPSIAIVAVGAGAAITEQGTVTVNVGTAGDGGKGGKGPGNAGANGPFGVTEQKLTY